MVLNKRHDSLPNSSVRLPIKPHIRSISQETQAKLTIITLPTPRTYRLGLLQILTLQDHQTQCNREDTISISKICKWQKKFIEIKHQKKIYKTLIHIQPREYINTILLFLILPIKFMAYKLLCTMYLM